MDLLPYGADDLWLTEALECDPAVMQDLGGPVPRESIPQIHQKRMAYIAKGAWWFKIVPDPAIGPVGTIGIWEGEWNGSPIHEMGWMVLPAFQGRGLASVAAQTIVERARSDGRFAALHAFTSISNGPSNAICRKLGFVQVEECNIEYAGRPLRCNHYRLDLWS